MAGCIGVLLFTLICSWVSGAENGEVTTEKDDVRTFYLDIYHVSSSITSIDVAWKTKVPDWMTIDKFEIITKKIGSGSTTLLKTEGLANDTSGYVVTDLTPDSEYDVCVVAYILNGTAVGATVEVEECIMTFTIPYVRDDSLYVLGTVIGLFVILMVIGCITWRCAVRSAGEHGQPEDKMSKIEDKAGPKEEQAPFLKPKQKYAISGE